MMTNGIIVIYFFFSFGIETPLFEGIFQAKWNLVQVNFQPNTHNTNFLGVFWSFDKQEKGIHHQINGNLNSLI